MTPGNLTSPTIPVSSPPAVELCAANRRYSGHTALTRVDWTVPQGGCLVVKGRNGAGKSTLLRLVAGLEPPSSGAVKLWGNDAMTVRVRRGRLVAAALGGFGFYDDLTLRNHLDLVGATWGRAELLSNPDQLLADLGLSTVAHLTPPELSSGLFQLFSLAVACQRPARLVVLDEPEQHLDPTGVERVTQLLGRVRGAGRTLVVATHSGPLVQALSQGPGGQVMELVPALESGAE
jgi:ABC-type multidrug transport system ATPase subunit